MAQPKDCACYLLIALASCLILAPWLFRGDLAIVSPSELGTDFHTKQWPNARYIVQSMLRWNEIPLWRTAALGGVPIVGNPSMLLAYPPYWLIFLINISHAFTIYFALHLTWAGWGAYTLARRALGVSPSAGLLTGTAFSLSAKMIAHIGGGHLDVIGAVAWLPWLWWAVDRLVHKPTWLTMSATALAITGQGLTHLPTLWLSALVVGGWGIMVQVSKLGSRSLHSWIRLGLLGLGALTLAAALAAAHIWPMLELLPFSTRSAMTLTEATRYALPIPLLANIVLPTALAFPEWVIYAGAVTSILAPAGHLAPDRDGRWWFLIALTGLGIIVSVGRATPVYALLFQFLPGMAWFRVPSRMMFVVQLALGLLAGMGLDCTRKVPFPRKRGLVFWWLTLAVVLIVGAIWSCLASGPFATPPLSPLVAITALVLLVVYPHTAAIRATAPLLLAILIVLEAKALAPYLTASEQSSELTNATPYAEFLQTRSGRFRTFSPDGLISLRESVVHRIETSDGNDPFQFNYYVDWMNAASGCEIDVYAVSVPACASNEVDRDPISLWKGHDPILLGLGNVEYLVADQHLAGWESPIWTSDGVRVYENPRTLPRAFVVSKVASELGNSAALAFLKEHEPKRIATIPTGKGRSCYPNGSYHPADIVRRTSNEVEILVEGPGWLVLSEVWAPGWGAYVDGSRERVYRTNVAFLGLPLSEGTHHVRFTYNPSGWRWGRWISLGTAVAMLLGTIIAVYKQRTQSTRQFR